MNKPFGNEDDRLWRYVERTYQPDDELLREIRERARRAGLPDIQVAALDARHLEVLARTAGARKSVEIGTLAGYSGVSILRGMGSEGVLDTIEMDPKYAEVARESFRLAGVSGQARVHVGLATALLPELACQAPFDFCFIDADKEGYPAYLRWAAEHLRPGGVVVLDNAFLFGHLADQAVGEHATAITAMQQAHELLAYGRLFRSTVLPTGEGLAIGVRL